MNQPLLSLENKNYFFTTDKTELSQHIEKFDSEIEFHSPRVFLVKLGFASDEALGNPK